MYLFYYLILCELGNIWKNINVRKEKKPNRIFFCLIRCARLNSWDCQIKASSNASLCMSLLSMRTNRIALNAIKQASLYETRLKIHYYFDMCLRFVLLFSFQPNEKLLSLSWEIALIILAVGILKLTDSLMQVERKTNCWLVCNEWNMNDFSSGIGTNCAKQSNRD